MESNDGYVSGLVNHDETRWVCESGVSQDRHFTQVQYLDARISDDLLDKAPRAV